MFQSLVQGVQEARLNLACNNWQTVSLKIIAIAIALFLSLPRTMAADQSAMTPGDLGQRQVIDLTHVLGPGLPDFHEGSAPFSYELTYTVKKDGYAGGKFSTPEHYGTHIDAPSHFVDGAASVDQVPADSLVRPCVVIDVRDEVKKNSDYQLTVEKIKSFETNGKIPAGCVVLLLTGWADRWSSPKEYRNADSTGTMRFPSYSPEAAAYLADEKVVGLGVDTISADYGLSTTYGVHHLTLNKGMFLIENLNNLDKLPARNALLFCGVLPIKNGTGAPARILAIVQTPAKAL